MLTQAAAQSVTEAPLTQKSSAGVRGSYTATTISFTSPDTIGDSGNGLAFVNVGDRISVKDSTLNSRSFKVKTVAAGTITTYEQAVATESAGATITLYIGDN